MIAKKLPIETILRDQEVAELYVQDVLTREAACGELQAVWNAWQNLLQTDLEKCEIPNDWHIGPVQNTSQSIHFGPHQPYFKDDQGVVPVFPNAGPEVLDDLVPDRYFFDTLIDRYRYMDR